jgi:hypothetical protein
MTEPEPLLYLLYALNGLAGALLGGFLYREYQEGFMVLVRERVISLKWLVVLLLLLVVALNLFWLLKVRGLNGDWLLLLLMFSGMVAPFLWVAALAVGRFLLLDVLMGFLGEVSDSFSATRQQLQQWLQQRDLAEEHQHDDRMEKIRKVRRQWAKRSISRSDAVEKISRISKKGGKGRKTTERKGGGRQQPAGDSMPGLMSGFIDRLLDEKERR